MTQLYICYGCGKTETHLERELFNGYKYLDILNFQAYCIACSIAFAGMNKLPDEVVDEYKAIY